MAVTELRLPFLVINISEVNESTPVKFWEVFLVYQDFRILHLPVEEYEVLVAKWRLPVELLDFREFFQ